MLKVKNKKAVNNLSNKSFRANKTRNIVAVIAIALTAVLFTALFTIGSGMIENFQKQTMRQAGGGGMGVLKYISHEEYEKIKPHSLIQEISYNRLLSESVDNEALLKRHGEFYYMDDTAIKLSFCEPTKGKKPQAENEVMMDAKTIKMLGAKQEIGAPVTLELTVHGKKVKRDFVISGWWEPDPVFNVSIIVASKAYMQRHIDELYNSYEEDQNMTGVINCYIMFSNSFGIEENLEQVIKESGYSVNEEDPNYIRHNVNWAYISTNFSLDPGTIAAGLAAVVLIVFTGYLIIYNIFQISVMKDIRFYGLLKTIGTTGKQIKKIIRRQALTLSCMGIPVGLLCGFFIGCWTVPMILNNTSLRGAQLEVSPNPWIFIGSAAFALITVAISTGRPGKIAAQVSPVEAVRYTDADAKLKRKKKKTAKGARIFHMAAANMGRNKKRTVLVVLSMSLSLVLFNTVYTFSLGFDMDKFLSKFVDTDYLAAHADYFNYEFTGPENSVSEQMIEAVRQQPGFEEGGRILGNIRDAECFTVEDEKNTQEKAGRDEDGSIFCPVYGMDDLPLGRLEVLEGEIDVEKLKTGEYILEGIQLNDDETPYWETSHFNIGDTVTLHNYKGPHDIRFDNVFQTKKLKVMAKVAVKNYTNSCGVGYEYNFYLPSNVYETMVYQPGIMSYVYNVQDNEEAAMDYFLENYTENAEPVMNYSSKGTRVKEFEGVRNMILLVGGALSLIIGLIGILNFVNSILTSILTRRREFAMLQSIGMTNRQLRKMLITEGLYYALGSAVVSILLGILFSGVIVKAVAQNLWFFSYQFTLLPLILTIPVLLVIGICMPVIVLKNVSKQSIVERLRETE